MVFLTLLNYKKFIYPLHTFAESGMDDAQNRTLIIKKIVT